MRRPFATDPPPTGAPVRIEAGLPDGELAEAAGALSDAFAEYPVRLEFTADSLRATLVAEDVIPEACRRARDPGGRLLGVGLAALRATRGRVAAMGVVRGAHRMGVGRALGEGLLEALTEAGAREVVLEALTTNTAALALYERRLGFERRRRLIGFERPAAGEPIDDARWEQALAAGGEPDSWQLARVVRRARAQRELVSVPAVVPERHAIAAMLSEAGFVPGPIAQYELGRSVG